ncbi:uncharacterized protein LOC125267389 [Megalobrama amblycephala]|uniref:uncharacterized protein LOC125267389 n=1 Tax=Megalobrama amblycephala TaxID=75352 RepID=UPI00201478B1|nr:uncharacterized protein LOC125267389 [Megalobrama amblycephala]XP_048044924.1 uncharacterized protein LOC125267389 [Megalobrama amblycephala]
MANAQPITKLNISTTREEEQILGAQGYKFINVNLNEAAGGNQIFLWYKKESGNRPVTRIEFSFNAAMKPGLTDAGYEVINRDLNAGACGDHIFLWYFYGSTEYDIPIVDLKVTKVAKEEPVLMKGGWERLGCDLNRNASKTIIYLWVKRAKTSYIQEIAATVEYTNDSQMFDEGYTRVGEDTNRGAPGNFVMLWYRRTTVKSKALTHLNISTSHEDEIKLQIEGYEKISVNLNTGTGRNVIYLWYKTEGDQSIQAMAQLFNPEAWIEYQKAGINFIENSLNEGNDGMKMYIAYK